MFDSNSNFLMKASSYRKKICGGETLYSAKDEKTGCFLNRVVFCSLRLPFLKLQLSVLIS